MSVEAAAVAPTTSVPVASSQHGRRSLLHGPVLPVLMGLALPTIGVLVAQTIVGIAETYYVSKLGTDALVGVSVVFPVWMLMTMISAGGLGNGVASAVARALGAGRDRDAEDQVLHAIVLATVMGSIFMLAVWGFGHRLFAELGAQGRALDQARAYSFWLFLSAIPIWIVNLCSAALRGAGNVRVPALVSLAGVVVLVGLSPLLIFGFGAFPGLGIAGAGVAVTAFYSGAAVILVRYLRRAGGAVRLCLRPLRWPLFRDTLSVGLMASISAAQLNLSVILVTSLAGTFGTATLAGYGIGARLDYLFIPVLFGLGSAVLTLVGTAIGAGDVARAKEVARTGTLIGAGFTGAAGVVVTLFPGLWLQIFTHDPQVLAAGSTYLQVVGPFYVATGATFILGFVSQGAKRPGWTTFAGTVRLAVVTLGGWAAVSLWHAGFSGLSAVVAAGQVVAAAISIYVVVRGVIWKA
ncbi:MATE family efflux transporter [Novosphingobium sp. KCTC 2891]|uniref:MATE family efflux transporter n=1 Tax=Novosphingobium sp. KCTC 2891 TaxID=2989730 RepID=UPI0022221452|nr:MATE family efflux transporter [Novosphingobium sp. KCTC 2891]MCW1383762.1 MATE family efflux transporter [Novosphingobium sp. KCTC 2891]